MFDDDFSDYYDQHYEIDEGSDRDTFEENQVALDREGEDGEDAEFDEDVEFDAAEDGYLDASWEDRISGPEFE